MQLFHGDCLEIMKSIPDASVDMILCDLPYGTTACKWDVVIPFEPLWEQYKRITKSDTAIVLFGAEPFSSFLRLSNLKMFKYDLIWNKIRGSNPGLAKIRPMPSFENLSVFGAGKIKYFPQMFPGKPYKDNRNSDRNCNNDHKLGFNKKWTPIDNKGTRFPLSIIDVVKFNQKGQHPTQKPTPLLEYLIKTYTNENDIVLDNCMGSGSTGVAAVNTKRHFIGIEKDEKYFKLAQNRIEEARQNVFI